jgi:hypothetical protein
METIVDMETFRKTLRRDKAKYICTPYFGKDYPNPLKEDEILLEPFPPSNVPSVGEIAHIIHTYSITRRGINEQAQAIHDLIRENLIGEKKGLEQLSEGKIDFVELWNKIRIEMSAKDVRSSFECFKSGIKTGINLYKEKRELPEWNKQNPNSALPGFRINPDTCAKDCNGPDCEGCNDFIPQPPNQEEG